jgi:hypothetical protein
MMSKELLSYNIYIYIYIYIRKRLLSCSSDMLMTAVHLLHFQSALLVLRYTDDIVM